MVAPAAAVAAATVGATVGHMVVVVDMEAAPMMTVRSMEPPKAAAMALVEDTMIAVGIPLEAAVEATIRSGSLEWSSSRGGPATVFDTSALLERMGCTVSLL